MLSYDQISARDVHPTLTEPEITTIVNVLVVQIFGKRTGMPESLPPRGMSQEVATIGHPLLLERTEVSLVT